MDWLSDKQEGPAKPQNLRRRGKKTCGQSRDYWSVDDARARGYTPGRPMTKKKLQQLIAQATATNAYLQWRLSKGR